MYKKRKKKKKKPDDGGRTLEQLKYYYPKVEEVLLLSLLDSRNHNIVLFFQWNEEKQKFYQRESRSDIFVRGRYGDIMYHPHGTKLFIPKNKGLQA